MNQLEVLDRLVLDRIAPFYEELDNRLKKIEGLNSSQRPEQPLGNVTPLRSQENGSAAHPEASNEIHGVIEQVIKLHRVDAVPVLHVSDGTGRMVPADDDTWEVGCVICKTTKIVKQGDPVPQCETVALLTSVLQKL